MNKILIILFFPLLYSCGENSITEPLQVENKNIHTNNNEQLNTIDFELVVDSTNVNVKQYIINTQNLDTIGKFVTNEKNEVILNKGKMISALYYNSETNSNEFKFRTYSFMYKGLTKNLLLFGYTADTNERILLKQIESNSHLDEISYSYPDSLIGKIVRHNICVMYADTIQWAETGTPIDYSCDESSATGFSRNTDNN